MFRINKLTSMLFFVLVMYQQKESDAARILGLFPLQGKSHFVMCETLMRALAARGHQVDVVSHFPLKNPPPNYRDIISLAGTLPNIVNNMTFQESQSFGTGSLEKMFRIAGSAVCNLLETPKLKALVENPPTDPPYDIIINEMFVADCYLAMARHLKVPLVGVVTSKLMDWMNLPLGNPVSTAYVPSTMSGFSQQMNFLERLLNTLISRFVTLQYHYFIPEQLALVEKYFGIKVDSINELYKDIAIVLVNTHPSFDFTKPMTPGVVEVGGLHVTDGHEALTKDVEKWLDESKNGCVYFSFGSMMKIESFPKETIKAFYAAFERIAPVRVLMKIPKKDELPPGLPKNVMTSPWLPQTRVLQHKNVKAFVTHGGLMSTQEAITYGVPMIDIPIFGDQFLNARLCEKRKIGITILHQDITNDSFTKAIETVLENPVYSENSKRMSKIWNDRPMKAIDTAIFWVEYVIRNGNLAPSPASDLTWWQVELLDVYAFIAFVLLLGLYIIYRVTRFLLSRLCAKLCHKSNSSQIASKSKKNK